MGRPKASIRRSPELAWVISIPSMVAAIWLTSIAATHPGGPPFPTGLGLTVLYLALFCAAQATTLNFDVRRYAITFSVTEIPMLLALYYVAPVTTVATRVLAAGIVLSWRRIGAVKVIFNMAST